MTESRKKEPLTSRNMRAAVEAHNLTFGERCLLAWLESYDYTGRSPILRGQKEMASALYGVPEDPAKEETNIRKVQRFLSALEGKGYIRQEARYRRNAGGRTTNTIHLLRDLSPEDRAVEAEKSAEQRLRDNEHVRGTYGTRDSSADSDQEVAERDPQVSPGTRPIKKSRGAILQKVTGVEEVSSEYANKEEINSFTARSAEDEGNNKKDIQIQSKDQREGLPISSPPADLSPSRVETAPFGASVQPMPVPTATAQAVPARHTPTPQETAGKAASGPAERSNGRTDVFPSPSGLTASRGPVASRPLSGGSPDSPRGLAEEFNRRVTPVFGTLPAAIGRVAANLKRWLENESSGITPEEIRQMIDVFCADPQKYRQVNPDPWEAFYYSRHGLLKTVREKNSVANRSYEVSGTANKWKVDNSAWTSAKKVTS